MTYRGFFYFFCISFLIYFVFFGKLFVIGQGVPNLEKLEELQKKFKEEQKKDSESEEIIENFVEFEKPEEADFISNLMSKAQGQLTPKKGYQYFNPNRTDATASYVQENTALTQEQSLLKNEDAKGDQKEKEKNTSNNNYKANVLDYFPNRYVNEEVVINLDSEGFISLNAEAKPYSKALIAIAKSFFYKWAEFVPWMQIKNRFLKLDKEGRMEGVVGLYFDPGTNLSYSHIIVPFPSQTMNDLTYRSFDYLMLPRFDVPGYEFESLYVRLSVEPDNLKAKGEFKFNIKKLPVNTQQPQ
jgi:hypothetical protein